MNCFILISAISADSFDFLRACKQSMPICSSAVELGMGQALEHGGSCIAYNSELPSFPPSFSTEAAFAFIPVFFLCCCEIRANGECLEQKCVFISLEAESHKEQNDFNEQTLQNHHLEALAAHVNQNLLKVGHIVKMN